MRKKIKRFTVLILFSSWFVIFGVPFSEAAGFFIDHSENDEQAAQHLASIPLPSRSEISSDFSTGLINVNFDHPNFIVLPNSPLQKESNFHFILSSIQNFPTANTPKIFQLFSVYRL